MAYFYRVVARNSAFGLLSQAVIKLLSFVFSVLIIRNLGVESYGQYAAVLAYGAVFVGLADLGLSPYAVRETARARDQPDAEARIANLLGNVLALRLGLSTLASALLIVSAWVTARPPEMIGAIALGCLGLVMYGVYGSAEAFLAGFERLDLTARSRVLNQLVFVLIGAGLLAIGLGYYGLIVANLLGIGLMTAFCWRAVCRLGLRACRPDCRLWRDLLRASIPFGVIGLTLGLSYKFDSVLLNIFRG